VPARQKAVCASGGCATSGCESYYQPETPAADWRRNHEARCTHNIVSMHHAIDWIIAWTDTGKGNRRCESAPIENPPRTKCLL
jgi:hypothetical protein